MGVRAFTRWYREATLTRQFGFLSLVVIGLITVALSLVLSFYLQKDLLEREWTITADYVHTEAFYHLSTSDFVDPWTTRAQERFRDFYEQTVSMPEIVRLKIYDSSATVVWSDEPRLLQTRYPDNPHLQAALAGRTVVNIQTGEGKREHIFERGRFPQLVELYVPVRFPGNDRVIGVVETYKAPTRVFANIRQGQLIVSGTALAGGAFLYLVLCGIVGRAARRIREQHEALELRSREVIATNRELEQRGRDLAAANEELRMVQAQLLEAERLAAIGEVVTAVAHGIRNPLANIRAAAEVAALRDRSSGAQEPNGYAAIVGQVDRLEERLRELLRFVGPGERGREAVDINAVIQGSLQLLAARLAERGLAVDSRLAPSLPPIHADSVLMEQVFLSLIGNAIEASPRGAGLIVTSGTQESADGRLNVYAEVTDSGMGIAEEAMSKIFAPFYTTKAQGTGLGLAIAKKFTEAYGGTIAVQSGSRVGTTFRLTFPALRVPAGARP